VTVAQHLFGIENIAVVHHSHCGATSFTAEGIIGAYRHEHDVDIAHLYNAQSICISDYVASLRHDTRLIRESLGTPRYVNIYGYFYEIDNECLTRIVSDPAPARPPATFAERVLSGPSEQWA
jgi:carbonic anhydrase